MITLLTKLDAIFDNAFRRGDTPGALMAVEEPGLSWRRALQPKGIEARYCIASCTKLYTATLVLKASDRGEMDLDAAAQRYLPAGTMAGLNRHDGIDHADAITVRQLLSNTSCIPDFFECHLAGCACGRAYHADLPELWRSAVGVKGTYCQRLEDLTRRVVFPDSGCAPYSHRARYLRLCHALFSWRHGQLGALDRRHGI